MTSSETVTSNQTATRDWRIGLRVTRIFRGPNNLSMRGQIVDVLPSGTANRYDHNGILAIELDAGLTILEPASAWVTA